MLVTEREFVLPKGYVDAAGTLHRVGVMRLATAADEILPLKDPRVAANPAYLAVILLSRVVTRLGTLSAVTPKTVEELFVSDLGYLQDFYNQINGVGQPPPPRPVTCPDCGGRFLVAAEAAPSGE